MQNPASNAADQGLGETMGTDLAALPDEYQERIREAVSRLITLFATMSGTTLPSMKLALVLPFSNN